MIETNKAKFLSASFRLICQGTTFDLRGLISEWGVTRVYVETRPPPYIETAIGHLCTIELGRLTMKGRLSRHFSEGASFFEIRFEKMDEPQLTFLQNLMETEGIHPGWIRRYPRIPVKQAEDQKLLVITLCLIRFLGEEIFAPVQNFSLGGMGIELEGADMFRDARVGKVVNLDLMTNQGEVLKNITAEVRNVSLIESVVDGKITITKRWIGLRFQNIELEQKTRFHGLIRDLCSELKRRDAAPV
jgi:hypothetical protein